MEVLQTFMNNIWHIENEIKQEKGTEAPALKVGRQLIPKVNKNKIENSEGSLLFLPTCFQTLLYGQLINSLLFVPNDSEYTW